MLFPPTEPQKGEKRNSGDNFSGKQGGEEKKKVKRRTCKTL